jgi:hypothetical protein
VMTAVTVLVASIWSMAAIPPKAFNKWLLIIRRINRL